MKDEKWTSPLRSSITPVSYTHLDVYKRQLKRYEIPASKLVLELGYSVDYEDEKEDFEPDEADTVEPVSYTHLDVYKRQLLYCAPKVAFQEQRKKQMYG